MLYKHSQGAPRSQANKKVRPRRSAVTKLAYTSVVVAAATTSTLPCSFQEHRRGSPGYSWVSGPDQRQSHYHAEVWRISFGLSETGCSLRTVVQPVSSTVMISGASFSVRAVLASQKSDLATYEASAIVARGLEDSILSHDITVGGRGAKRRNLVHRREKMAPSNWCPYSPSPLLQHFNDCRTPDAGRRGQPTNLPKRKK